MNQKDVALLQEKAKNELIGYIHAAADMEQSLQLLRDALNELKSNLSLKEKQDPTLSITRPLHEADLVPVLQKYDYRKETSTELTNAIQRYRRENASKYWSKTQVVRKSMKNIAIWATIFMILMVLSVVVILVGVVIAGGGGVFTILASEGVLDDVMNNPIIVELAGALTALFGVAAIYIFFGIGIVIQLVAHLGWPVVLVVSLIVFGVKAKKINAKNDATASAAYRDELEKHNRRMKQLNAEAEIAYQAECIRCEQENKAIAHRNEERGRKYFDDCEAAKANHKKEISLLEKQIANTEESIRKLEKQRVRFYEPQLIPVDYRNTRCVSYLDFAFRNDLVDTVRQGIDRYEEAARHEALVNTVAAGFQMIDKTLTAVNKQLGLMRKESRMMCDEICAEIRSVAWEQKDARFAMEDLLDESRMNRYATEALHRTAKSVEDYARWTWIKDTRF